MMLSRVIMPDESVLPAPQKKEVKVPVARTTEVKAEVPVPVESYSLKEILKNKIWPQKTPQEDIKNVEPEIEKIQEDKV